MHKGTIADHCSQVDQVRNIGFCNNTSTDTEETDCSGSDWCFECFIKRHGELIYDFHYPSNCKLLESPESCGMYMDIGFSKSAYYAYHNFSSLIDNHLGIKMQYPTFFSKMLTCDSDNATCTIYLKPAYNFKIYGSKDTLPIPVNFTISTKPIDKSITIEKYANLLFDGYRKNPRVSLYTATVHNTPKNATYSLVYETKSKTSWV